MKILKNSVEALLRAEQQKNEARDAFRVARIGDEGYDQIQRMFRSADDAFEDSADSVIKLMQQLIADDELSEELSELDELSLPFTRFAESRGLNLLIESDNTGLAQMTKRWQKAANKMTAFRQLNLFRQGLSVPDFEEMLSERGPVNVDETSWKIAAEAFTKRLDELNEATNYGVEPDEVMREAAFQLEQESRRAYDLLTERFVSILRDLQDSGQLTGEMEELDYTLLPVVRDAMTRVPQPQKETQPEHQTRSVTVL